MDRKRVWGLLNLLKVERITDSAEWVRASCPFAPFPRSGHSKGTDTRPSFGVSVGKQSHYHCFTCNRGGPLPMLVTALCMLRGKDDLNAREYIMRNEDLSLDPYEDLKKGPEPLVELAAGILQRFAPATTELPIVQLRGITRDTIQRYNLRWDGIERRLIFPVFSSDGKLVGFRGRAAGDATIKYREYSELCPKKQSLKGNGVWYGMHRSVEVPEQKVILVEGEMDAIKLSQALNGRGGVWASMGASISDEQIRVLQALRNPILLFFDNDEAGMTARNRVLSKIKKVKTGIYVVTDYAGCKDPDEIVSKGLLKKALQSIEMVG